MAGLCLRRLCTRPPAVFNRQIYSCQVLSVCRPPVIVNRRISQLKYFNSTTSLKLIPQPCCVVFRNYSESKADDKELQGKPPEKLSLLQRFKQMYRDYWYVLVPVHLVTSAAWFGGFYYLAKSGVDIAGILESWNVSTKITNTLKDSSMGYIAVSYALYKIATPLRYTVTLGGTTVSINYLKKWGYIKPVPSTDALKEMYKERKENFIETMREKRDLYKEKKDNIIESVRETQMEVKMQKEKLKGQKDSLVKDIEESFEKIKKAKTELTRKPHELISKKDETG